MGTYADRITLIRVRPRGIIRVHYAGGLAYADNDRAFISGIIARINDVSRAHGGEMALYVS